MNTDKFLLCRPRGGLNDNLTQIEHCWRYAERNNRILIIDTSDSPGIFHPFGSCFKLVRNNPMVVSDLTKDYLEKLEKLSTFPKSIQGRLNYKSIYSKEVRNYVDTVSGERICFNLTKDYSEELLVRDQCGGSVISLNCLSRLKLAPELKTDVLKRLAPLKGSGQYVALVVRNTNTSYQTDYEKFFNECYPATINQRLLICSDSTEVIDYAKAYFSESEVIALADTPNTGGLGLAEYVRTVGQEQRYKILVKALSDLIGLAASSTLFTCRLKSGGIKGFSGFSLLAGNLYNNPEIISQLLAD